jgi:hypothetical protein
MIMKFPRVAVVVLNWNGLEDTLECLESLSKSVYPNIEVIVVDNGSSDGSPEEIAGRFPDVHLIRNPGNMGFSGGNNVGIREAFRWGADFVWLLNNDTVVEPEALDHLVRAARQSDEIGLVSPVIRFFEDRARIQFCGSYVDWKKRCIVKVENPGSLPGNGMNISLWGTALLIKRGFVERAGYLDEKYFAYHEDEEYCMRAARTGYRCVVVPEARVFHKNSRSTGSNDAPMQVFLRSRNLFFLWMDNLKGMKRVFHIPRYLAHIISYGGDLKEKNLSDSVEACMDGVWHAFRGAGGPRNPEITMPMPLRGMFRFLFSWHPFLWSSLLRGDIAAIGTNINRRLKSIDPPN